MTGNYIEIFADYFQIYVGDKNGLDTDLSELICDESLKLKLVYTPEIISIFTARNMSVPLKIEQVDSEPSLDLEAWDHIVECSLNLSSGSLVVAGGSDYLPDATRISVKPGIYRMRIFYGGLNTLSQDGLDGEDRYKIVFWTTKKVADVTLLKEHFLSVL